MREYPTPEQFTEHPCEHAELREGAEYCVFFANPLDHLDTGCSPRCPEYSPWDSHLKDLFHEAPDTEDTESAVIVAIQTADARGTQPRCPSCGRPLEVTETQTVTLRWTWDTEARRYRKSQDDGESDGPRCVACGVKCWEFTNNGVMEY